MTALRALLRRLAPLIALASASFAAVPAPAEEAPIVEEFQHLDPEIWYISDGWTNGLHQGCHWSRSQVEAVNGILRMTLERDPETPSGVACAEIQTRARRRYGLYEVRMRAAAGGGLVSAFFTYTGPEFGQPHDEIDIEFLGKDPRRVQFNFYSDGVGDHEEMAVLPVPADGGFVVYGFRWQPGRITWYVDGRSVHEVVGPSVPRTPGKIMLSLWNGTDTVVDWLGRFRSPERAKVMEVDWIAFTPPGQRCLVPGSVSCNPAFRW